MGLIPLGRRAVLVVASLLALGGVLAGRAFAADPVTSAAQALRTTNLYVDPGAASVLSASDLSATRAALAASTAPVFVAVVPSTAATQVGGPDNLPTVIGRDTGRSGTYLVVSDKGVRASSNVLAAGEAGSIAASALRANQSAGRGAVVVAFIRDATSALQSQAAGSAPAANGSAQAPPTRSTSSGSRSSALLVLLGLVVAAGAFLGLRSSRRRKARAASDATELEARKADVQADLTTLEQDLMVHDSGDNPSPQTPADRSLATAWARYTSAGAALGSARTLRDLDRITVTIRQARAAFEDGIAQREGRPTAKEVYETVAAKAEQGAVPSPAHRLAAAPDGQAVGSTTVIQNYSTVNYPGYGYGWYPGFGYGYYGYGGGFVSGMLLGEMLGNNGAWGYGYGGGFDGGFGDRDQGDYGQGYGDQGGGGDWSPGGSNGGDWGGGGGADTGGGGDWGGGGFDTGGGGGDWGGGGGDSGGGGNW